MRRRRRLYLPSMRVEVARSPIPNRRQEAGRRDDRELLAQGEPLTIALHQHRLLVGSERDEVVVIGVDESHGRAVGIVGNHVSESERSHW
jgi:hypothetical protein